MELIAMTVNDPYGTLKNTLPLLDLMHRFLLPRISRDMADLMKRGRLKRILDVACGTGYTVCELRKRGINTVGVDLSPGMLSVASQKAGGCGFVLGDGTNLPFSTSFDGAVISLALHEVSPSVREAVWSEMKRVVRPGGLLFVVDFAKMPGKRTLYSKLVTRFILAIERATLKFDPDHWYNSMNFQEVGGLSGWLAKDGDELVEARVYAGGNLVLAVVTND